MYMFRTLWVHHQEDCLYMQFCKLCFLCIYVSSLAVGVVFSNTLFHLLDLKNVHFVGLRHFIVSQCTVQETQNIRLQHAVAHGVWSSLILRNWSLASPDVFLSTLSCFILSLYSSYCLSLYESLTSNCYWIHRYCSCGCALFLGLGKLLLYWTQWRSWLRQCVTSRKVAGSIPDGVIGIFH
jgi:hypothetical protein